MEKIPVGQSIGGAYGFLFGRILTIIGLSWLPAVFYAAARLCFAQHAEFSMSAAMHGQMMSPQAHLFHLGFVLISALLISMIAVSLTREALGMGGERVLAYFVIGGKEIRLFLALLRFYILLIVLVVALVVGVGVVGIGVQSALSMGLQTMMPPQWPVRHVIVCLAIVLALGVLLFAVLRLTFLLAPVAVAEDHAKLARAWELSRGNFWRMLAINLACVVPVLAGLMAVEYAVLGSRLREFAHAISTNGMHGDIAAIFQLPADQMIFLVAIATVGMVILSALFAGASATAYRALVPPAEPQDPQEEQEEQEPYGEPPAPLAHHDSGEAHHADHDHAHDHNHDHGHDHGHDRAHEGSDERSDAGEEQSDNDAPEQNSISEHGHKHENVHENDKADEEHGDGDDHAPGHDHGHSEGIKDDKAITGEENHDPDGDQKHDDDQSDGGDHGHEDNHANADGHGNGDGHDKAHDQKEDGPSDHGSHSPPLSGSRHPTDLRG